MIRGWEFFILNPYEKIEKCTQDTYLDNYNLSYIKFISDICIPEPVEILKDTGTFLHFIDCTGDNDIINISDDYEFKFKKSVFFEKKYQRIKRDLVNYYSSHNMFLNRLYKSTGGFIIEIVYQPEIK